MLFGNENRHLNNIAVLRRGEGFDYCPLFDFGAGLLSNTRDYPLDLSPAPTCGCTRFRWALLSADRSRPPGLFTALSWSGPLPPMTSPTRWPDRWSFMPSGTGPTLPTGDRMCSDASREAAAVRSVTTHCPQGINRIFTENKTIRIPRLNDEDLVRCFQIVYFKNLFSSSRSTRWIDRYILVQIMSISRAKQEWRR